MMSFNQFFVSNKLINIPFVSYLTLPERVKRKAYPALEDQVKRVKETVIMFEGIEVTNSKRVNFNNQDGFYIGQVVKDSDIPHGSGALFSASGALIAKGIWSHGAASDTIEIFTVKETTPVKQQEPEAPPLNIILINEQGIAKNLTGDTNETSTKEL